MRITRPGHAPDYSLQFLGTKYPISKCLFGLYSARFREELGSLPPPPYRIETTAGADAVRAFVDACQGRPYAITAETVADQRVLCESWGVPSVLAELQAFSDRLPVVEQRLLDLRVCVALERGPEGALEALAQCFPALLESAAFLELDISLIRAIVAAARESGSSAAAGADASAVAECAAALSAKWGSACPDFGPLLKLGSLPRESLGRLPAELPITDCVAQLEALKAELCAGIGCRSGELIRLQGLHALLERYPDDFSAAVEGLRADLGRLEAQFLGQERKYEELEIHLAELKGAYAQLSGGGGGASDAPRSTSVIVPRLLSSGRRPLSSVRPG
jgi:hypothetical protein